MPSSGENGAGKSTPREGPVRCGAARRRRDAPEWAAVPARGRPRRPCAAGVRVVYQELNQLTYLTVEENLSFEHLPAHRGLLDRTRAAPAGGASC